MAISFGTPVPRINLRTIGPVSDTERKVVRSTLNTLSNRYPFVPQYSLGTAVLLGRKPTFEEIADLPTGSNVESLAAMAESITEHIPKQGYAQVGVSEQKGSIWLKTIRPSEGTTRKAYSMAEKEATHLAGYSYGVKGLRATTIHEFGHHFVWAHAMVHDPEAFMHGNFISDQDFLEHFNSSLVPTIAGAFLDVHPRWVNKKTAPRYLAAAIGSDYATENEDELMAEIFTRAHVGGIGAAQAKKAIGVLSIQASKKAKMLRSAEGAIQGLLDMRR